MRRLFAVLISALLIFGFAPVAKADVAGLTPCAESARFQQRAAAATTEVASITTGVIVTTSSDTLGMLISTPNEVKPPLGEVEREPRQYKNQECSLFRVSPYAQALQS